MKKIFLILLFFIPLLGYSELPPESTQHLSYASSYVELYPNQVWLQFITDDEGSQYLKLNIVKGENIEITPENTAIFQGDYSIGQFKPIHDFHSIEGGGKIDNNDQDGLGVSVLYRGNLGFFKDAHVSSLKIFTTNNYINIPINDKTSKLIKETYLAMLNYQSKAKVKVKIENSNGSTKLVSQYQLQFCKKRKSRNTWDVIKESTQNLTREELEKIVSEWNSMSDDEWDYQCKVQKL